MNLTFSQNLFNGYLTTSNIRTAQLNRELASITLEGTRAEFNLLAALVKAPNRVQSRAQLLDAVSQDADAPTDRLIDVLVSRIRKKIEQNPKSPEIITTVLGCGYKFSAELDP
jgi:DNA-binding response OmpR family regulator